MSQVRWTTRVMLGAAVAAAEQLAFTICQFGYLTIMSWLGATWNAVVDKTGTILITIVAPALAFWLVRSYRRDAREISWLLLLPVVAANMVLRSLRSTVFTGAHRWLALSLVLGLPFIGAVLGSFISAVRRPGGAAPNQTREVRIL